MAKIQALYSRVSTDIQREKGFSVPRQKEWLEEEAKIRKFKNIKHYPDNGYSAKDINRPSFKKLLSDIENESVDVVMVYKSDRIARHTVDLLGFIDLCEKHKVEFISLSEKFDTTTPTGRLTITILASLAEWERGQTVERVRDVMWSKVEKGDFCGGQPSLGFDVKDKRLIHNEKEADIMRQIYDRFEDELSYRGLTVWLNSRGYKTKRGTTFAQSTVKRLLTNPIYKGYQSFGKRVGGARVLDKNAPVFKANVEPIISEEQFERVQYLIKTKKNEKRQLKHGQIFLLSGLCKCECGSSLDGYPQFKKSNGKLYCYYICHDHTQKGTCIYKIRIPKEDLETKVIEEVRRMAKIKFEEAEAAEFAKRNNKDTANENLKRVETSIRDLKAKKGRLIDALADGSLPKEDVVKKFDKITLDLEDAEKERQILLAEINPAERQKRASLLERVNELNGDIFSLKTEDKKSILKQLIKEIRVSKSGEVEVDLYDL